MITCRLKGGIGNMLFQIAAIEHIGKVGGIKTYYFNIDSNLHHLNNDLKHNPSMKHSFDYKQIFKNFNWHTSSIESANKTIKLPFEYTPIEPINNIKYDGFFQSEKYFPNRKHVNWLFEPSDFVKTQLAKYSYLKEFKTCSMHIRRGDYLKFSSHPVQTLQYYQQAQKIIGAVDKYIVFSDDIEWCKETFKGNNYIFIENEKDYIEIFLQAQCNHNIIANSSFSWWGAYLNKDINKKVVAPNNWFSNGSKYSDKDIIPKSWIKQ